MGEPVKKKSPAKKLTVLGILAAIILAVVLIPSWRKAAGNVFRMLAEADLEEVKTYIRSFGGLAVVISIALMVLQSIAAPIPAFVITLANAGIFGWLEGAAISWAGAMLGAAICFGLARFFGRSVVEKLTGKGVLESVDSFLMKHGGKSIFIARLLPFVPFDPISYAAGLTGMKPLSFLAATGLGQLPATLVYSYTGSTMLSGSLQYFFYGLCSLMALGGLSMILRSVYVKRQNKVKEEGTREDENRE